MGQVWLSTAGLSQDCVSVLPCTRIRWWLNNLIWTRYFSCCTELMHLRVNTSTSILLHPLQICELRPTSIGDRLSEQLRSRITATDPPCNQYSLLNCSTPRSSLSYTVVTVAPLGSPSDLTHRPWFLVSVSTHSSQEQAAAVTPQADSPSTTTAGLLLLWNLCRRISAQKSLGSGPSWPVIMDVTSQKLAF